MNEEYTKYFEKFHKERLSYLSGKDKYKKCKGCETDKNFTEEDNELIYSCGSTDHGEDCGDQFKIKLPEYKNYYEEKQRLMYLIHGSFNYIPDKKDLSEYNLEKLRKYMKIEEEYSKQQTTIDMSSDKLKECKDKYIKDNNLTKKMNDIQALYVLKKKDSLQKDKIMKQLKDPLTIDEKKEQLRKEYAKVTYENQREILALIETLKEEPNEYIKTKEEKIDILNKNFDFGKEKSKKEKKKIKKISDDLNDFNDEGYNLCKELSETKLTNKEIKEKREKIHKEVIKEAGGDINIDNFKDVIKDAEMKMLFNLYDKYFFDDKLDELSKKNDCKWVVCWNNRCIKTAGLTRCKIDGTCKVISIELSSQVFGNVIKKMIKEDKDFIRMDDKNECDSILSCLMLTFEHELVHALQECFCPHWSRNNNGPGNWSGKKGAGSSHSKTFMSILNNTFGHIDYTHKLFSSGDKKRKEELEEPEEPEEPEELEEPKRKGLGDELEELQVEIIKGVTLAEQENRKKREKKEKKKKKKKPKKLTKEGKKWVKAAVENMKQSDPEK